MRGLVGLIARRRAEPTGDVISVLATAEIDGAPIPVETVLNIVDLLIVAGFDTTTAALANALIHLDRCREDRRRLIEDPSLIPRAVEEFLRVHTPQQALARTVTRDTELGGQPLSAGDRVLLSWASANMDAEVFDDPEALDIARSPNRHLAFGVGVHRCVGSHIARAQLTAMIAQVLERMPDYRILHQQAEQYPTIGVINGWVCLPAVFTPGERRGQDALPGR